MFDASLSDNRLRVCCDRVARFAKLHHPRYPQLLLAFHTPLWTGRKQKAPWTGAFGGVSQSVLDD
jgi:hypothetical protein